MKPNDRIVIAIEGIDGAGKSTLIAEITKQYKGDFSLYERTKKGKVIELLLRNKRIQKYHMLQVPIYLFLSYKNYCLLKINDKKTQIVIMDRCYLSNVCYFFPYALDNKKLLKRILFWEIHLFPETIFVLDVNPEVGMRRDNNKKTLEWLAATRRTYLRTAKSMIKDFANIVILEEELTAKEKAKKVIECMQGEIDYGN